MCAITITFSDKEHTHLMKPYDQNVAHCNCWFYLFFIKLVLVLSWKFEIYNQHQVGMRSLDSSEWYCCIVLTHLSLMFDKQSTFSFFKPGCSSFLSKLFELNSHLNNLTTTQKCSPKEKYVYCQWRKNMWNNIQPNTAWFTSLSMHSSILINTDRCRHVEELYYVDSIILFQCFPPSPCFHTSHAKPLYSCIHCFSYWFLSFPWLLFELLTYYHTFTLLDWEQVYLIK